MKDASSVISSLGGTGAVAKSLNVAHQVVCNWAARNAIPWERHTDILRVADQKGISLLRSDLESLSKRRAA